MKQAKAMFFGVLVGLALCFAWLTVSDAIEYFDILDGNYTTPWYDTSYLKQPFTNFILSGKNHHTYWTTNACGNQQWKVRETYVEGKTFWTVLERKPNNP